MMSCEGEDTTKWTRIGSNHGAKTMFFSKTRRILPSNLEITQKPSKLSSLQN